MWRVRVTVCAVEKEVLHIMNVCVCVCVCVCVALAILHAHPPALTYCQTAPSLSLSLFFSRSTTNFVQHLINGAVLERTLKVKVTLQQHTKGLEGE
jgi:hypothetical protein